MINKTNTEIGLELASILQMIMPDGALRCWFTYEQILPYQPPVPLFYVNSPTMTAGIVDQFELALMQIFNGKIFIEVVRTSCKVTFFLNPEEFQAKLENRMDAQQLHPTTFMSGKMRETIGQGLASILRTVIPEGDLNVWFTYKQIHPYQVPVPVFYFKCPTMTAKEITKFKLVLKVIFDNKIAIDVSIRKTGKVTFWLKPEEFQAKLQSSIIAQQRADSCLKVIRK